MHAIQEYTLIKANSEHETSLQELIQLKLRKDDVDHVGEGISTRDVVRSVVEVDGTIHPSEGLDSRIVVVALSFVLVSQSSCWIVATSR